MCKIRLGDGGHGGETVRVVAKLPRFTLRPRCIMCKIHGDNPASRGGTQPSIPMRAAPSATRRSRHPVVATARWAAPVCQTRDAPSVIPSGSVFRAQTAHRAVATTGASTARCSNPRRNRRKEQEAKGRRILCKTRVGSVTLSRISPALRLMHREPRPVQLRKLRQLPRENRADPFGKSRNSAGGRVFGCVHHSPIGTRRVGAKPDKVPESVSGTSMPGARQFPARLALR